MIATRTKYELELPQSLESFGRSALSHPVSFLCLSPLPLSLSLYVSFFHLLIPRRAGDTLGLMVVFSMLLLRRDAI